MEAFEIGNGARRLSFTSELSESIQTAQQKLMAQALEIYYAAEQLARDPEHSHLIPYVEQMRAAYRRDFGRDIPER